MTRRLHGTNCADLLKELNGDGEVTKPLGLEKGEEREEEEQEKEE